MHIVEKDNAVTLVGGGALQPDDLHDAVALAPFVVAADSGADAALAHGVQPELVVGDFDSIAPQTRAGLPRSKMLHIREQDTTDFDKALRHIQAPVVLAVGFLGARVDHQLAALHVLVQPRFSQCILIGEHEILFHLTRDVQLPTQAGDVVSLFPMQPVTGWSNGLEWPIRGLTLDPMARIGTSNRATGPCELGADGPGLVAILPKRYLGAVMAQLTRPPAG